MAPLPPPGYSRVACPRCHQTFDIPTATLPTAQVVAYENPLAPPEEYDPPPRASMGIGNWLQVFFILAVLGGGLATATGSSSSVPSRYRKPWPGRRRPDVRSAGRAQRWLRPVQLPLRLPRPSLAGGPEPEKGSQRRRLMPCAAATDRPGCSSGSRTFAAHTPRDSEVREEGIARLEKLFHGLYLRVAGRHRAGGSQRHAPELPG